MRSVGILIFLLTWSGASYAAASPCATSSFLFTGATKQHGEGKVEKKGCLLRFITYLGQGEKYEVDVCKPEVQILKFKSLLDTATETIPAGSAHCPLPLFGADFAGHSGSAEGFTAVKKRLEEILKDVKRVYLKPGGKMATKAQKDADEKFACLETALKKYLDECEPLEL